MFIERMEGMYTEFQSAANEQWRIGFKPRGKPMKGYDFQRFKSTRKRRCFQFTKRKLEKTISRQHQPHWDFSQLAKTFRFYNRNDEKT